MALIPDSASSLPPSPTRITVLISGNGSNLLALINASTTPSLPHTTIVRVISNKKDAYGLQRASAAQIPTTYHNLIAGRYIRSNETDPAARATGRRNYDAALAALVLADAPHLVVCAGFMHILHPVFLDPLSAAGVPVINLHPALPGMYDGTQAIPRAYADFQNGKLKGGVTGLMIHYVIAEVDRGEPIVVREVRIREGESLEELEARMHAEEHELIVEGTRKAIETLKGREPRR